MLVISVDSIVQLSILQPEIFTGDFQNGPSSNKRSLTYLAGFRVSTYCRFLVCDVHLCTTDDRIEELVYVKGKICADDEPGGDATCWSSHRIR
jgi:hypothetical protein